ncbi:MAG: ATP-binding protein [Lachnospiraceae bacterium]|nr:ATP-binding protein [Lachnospiraceae bacterium]
MHYKDLILYRFPGENRHQVSLLREFAGLIERCREAEPVSEEEQETLRLVYYRSAGRLFEIASSHGFSGNLWQDYLTLFLVDAENAYSISCEKRGEQKDSSVNALALHDLAIIRELFDFDLEILERELAVDGVDALLSFTSADENGFVFNRRIRDRIQELSGELAKAESVASFQKALSLFYEQFGVGTFGLHKAFRLSHDETGALVIQPITRIAHVSLSDLVGYETAKKKLIDNTEAFVKGLPANNCILYGDAGTGKSSSIKAILHQYYDQGLRMVELYKHQFQDLNPLIGMLKNRNYRFIIYMDDLSFEAFETEYKYLKALIEGGLEKKPENILIYATSNRRHLIRENFSDRDEQDDDIHRNATVQEKLSLVSRFGVSIYFGAPEPEEYENIVLALAKRNGISLPREELLAGARQWELSHGGRSGRTAVQYITYLGSR